MQEVTKNKEPFRVFVTSCDARTTPYQFDGPLKLITRKKETIPCVRDLRLMPPLHAPKTMKTSHNNLINQFHLIF